MKLFPRVDVLLLKCTGKHAAIQDLSSNCEKPRPGLAFAFCNFVSRVLLLARDVLRIMVGIMGDRFCSDYRGVARSAFRHIARCVPSIFYHRLRIQVACTNPFRAQLYPTAKCYCEPIKWYGLRLKGTLWSSRFIDRLGKHKVTRRTLKAPV